VDFVVRQDPETLGSTGYVEIGPGRFSGRHWQQGSIFIWEDAFTVTEGIFRTHFPEYDHFAMNDIPRGLGLEIVKDLRSAASALTSDPLELLAGRLRLEEWQSDYLREDLQHQRPEIATMMLQLADAMDAYYQEDEWACVLGV